jgi:hypothetical protein
MRQNYYIVDRLFGAAELRLGGEHQSRELSVFRICRNCIAGVQQSVHNML